jgi:cytochrome c oxidase subunit 1
VRTADPGDTNMSNAHEATGIKSWLTTVDHKRIGILYGASAFLFFLIGGCEALLIRWQLHAPDQTFLTPEMYNQLFTMHGTSMIFLGIMPLSAMFFNYIIPLQIGARDVAFPRLNAFSFWTFLLGGLLLNVSFLFNAAPNAGWFGYANLTSKQFSPGLNTDFWVAGLQILGIASLAAGVNFAVTIVNMRAPGMKMLRLPVFSWMSLITQVLVLLSFPIITVALVMLMYDRFFGSSFFVPGGGGDPLLWQHLFWLFGHPEVYILILPAFGIISEILPVFSRKPLFGYTAMVFSGCFIAFLGFGVWSHHMFAVGMGPVADTVFSLMTMLIAIPTGVKVFNWIGTVWGGSIQLKTPMYFALGFIAMFIMGGLSGVMHSVAPADLQQTDTYFVVAHFHYVMMGSTLVAFLGALHYWWPKFTGRMYAESLARVCAVGVFFGFNLTFLPQFVMGARGMPRRYWDYDAQYTIFHQLSTIGAFVLGISMFTVVVYLMASWKTGKRAPRNPWGGSSLEWQAPTPPPLYNFEKPPVLHELYNYDDLVEVGEDQWERRAPNEMEPEDAPGDAHAHARPGAQASVGTDGDK